MTLGETIRHHREARGLSKRELGKRIGRSNVAVLYWERDGRTPHPRTRRLLEQEFNLPHLSLETERATTPGVSAAALPTAPNSNVQGV